MNTSLNLNSVLPHSSFNSIDKEVTFSTQETSNQKTTVAALAALQVLGLFIFGAIAGVIIGATCAKTETVVALPGKTELSLTGHVLIPVIVGLAFGVFAGIYLVHKAISDPKKYLEDLVDEQINKKALEIDNERSPYKKEELQQQLDKLLIHRQDVTKAPFEIESRLYDWAATKIAATLVR